MQNFVPISDTVLRVRCALLVVLCLTVLVVWVVPKDSLATNENELAVTFLDVGQGDAIFIETPDGVQMLVDGGRDGAVLRELGAVLGWGDRTIDVVVSTHPDEDHIGGLVDVLDRYAVATLLTTENTGESLTARAYQQAVKNEGAELRTARAGQTLQLGASTSAMVYSPAQNPAQLESNTSSIVLQVRYGEIEFMLTGDAPAGIEEYLVTEYGEQLESEVLKLGHHGSDTSSSEAFLTAVQPLYAVVSAGNDNRYGHPKPVVVERASEAGAQVVQTSDSGRITFVTDGRSVWQE